MSEDQLGVLALTVLFTGGILTRIGLWTYWKTVWLPRRLKNPDQPKPHGQEGVDLIESWNHHSDLPIPEHPPEPEPEPEPPKPSGSQGSIKTYRPKEVSWVDRPEIDDDWSWYG